MSAFNPHATDVDIMGVKRGAHSEGAAVCAQYVFHKPGKAGLSGWNDISAIYCETCGKRDIDHIEVPDEAAVPSGYSWQAQRNSLRAPARPSPAAPAAPRAQVPVKPAVSADNDGLLNDTIDPLALGSGRAPQRRPPPAAPAPVAEPAAVPSGDPEADFKAEVEAMVKRQTAQEQQDAADFKAEVERMVMQPGQAHGAAAPGGGGDGGGGSWGTSSDMAGMLDALGISQHAAAFQQAGLRPSTLSALLHTEGKAALDGRLKQLGVPMGHRLKVHGALR